jgi:transposase
MQDNYNIDVIWNKLLPFFQTVKRVYKPTDQSTKLFLEGSIWMLKSGAQWRMLPKEYGRWNTVFKRFARWARRGIWEALFNFCITDPDLEWICVDATIVRAHACAAGYQHSNETQECLGRSKGGYTSKIHAVTDALGNPIKIIITPGQRSDITQAPALIDGINFSYALGDKGYDCDAFRAQIVKQGGAAVIPPRSNRKEQIDYDKDIYNNRYVIECFFGKIKFMRCIFSRFDKSVRNFAAFLALAAALVWSR